METCGHAGRGSLQMLLAQDVIELLKYAEWEAPVAPVAPAR